MRWQRVHPQIYYECSKCAKIDNDNKPFQASLQTGCTLATAHKVLRDTAHTQAPRVPFRAPQCKFRVVVAGTRMTIPCVPDTDLSHRGAMDRALGLPWWGSSFGESAWSCCTHSPLDK